MIKKLLKVLSFILISIPLIYFDQWSKNWASLNLKGKEAMTIIKNCLYFLYHENRGAAFGILQNQQNFFYIITVVILLVLIIYIYFLEINKYNIWIYIAFELIFAGAIGNFIDRYFNKFVVDFIYFSPIDFPVFNVADSYISIGATLLILYILFSSKREIKEEINIKAENDNNENHKSDSDSSIKKNSASDIQTELSNTETEDITNNTLKHNEEFYI